jgi:hypothetical protein
MGAYFDLFMMKNKACVLVVERDSGGLNTHLGSQFPCFASSALTYLIFLLYEQDSSCWSAGLTSILIYSIKRSTNSKRKT